MAIERAKVNYKPLWKMLIDRDITKQELREKTSIARSTMAKMVNNEYVATDVDRVGADALPQRFSLSNSTANGSLYVDNIQAYMISYETPELGIDSVNYEINGEAVSAVSDGNLTATINLTNNGSECEAVYYVAVYEGTKLAKLYTNKVSFADGETHRRVLVDAGKVTTGMSVKTMLWNVGSVAPVCASNELK